MDLIEKITSIIEPSLDDMGYVIVQIKMADGDRRKTLAIMAERKDGVVMGFDDCTEISRVVGALLEVDDPITGAYNLEVCSPGIDRPLTRPEDYSKYAGYEAKIETQLPIEGRKRFRGVLKGMNDNKVTMNMDGKDTVISFSNIRTAKLVMTDALVAEHLKKQKQKV
ncbi:MAG: ribosome maturation factor RimP [Alphaproteobacteria bacterium]